MRRFRFTAGVLMLAAIGGLPAEPPAPPRELSLPARLHAELTIVNPEEDPRTKSGKTAVGGLLWPTPADRLKPTVQFPETSASLTIEIRRWSLEEEEDALRAAIDSGGVPAVIKATKNLKTLGAVHVGGEGVAIRAASTWITDDAQRIRLVFSSRLVTENQGPFSQTTRALDILDLRLPHGRQYGTGSLITATKVEYKEPGLIEPVTFAMDTVTQPVDKVERLPAKSE
ncbi:MAG TPA: hypothetical protein VGS03_18615 [Candidatus Polarisedimenticolia bacterium]|nr:hypothetical protein [Candidatus Polarisedimenticolia bacterium]